MSPVRRARAGACAVVLGACCCAPALRTPPSLAELDRGGRARGPEEVDGLLARAQGLYERRDAPSVREAVATWIAAAGADMRRTEGLVGASRGNAWLADHEADPAKREAAAASAVQTAQLCLEARPDSAACEYWLGAGLGLQAREKPSTGLSALPKIAAAFERAAAADPHLEEAGPDRALALFYARAPGWPRGPGDPDRALAHARKAVELEPEYPPNQLALAEALRATESVEAGRDACRRALELAETRRTTGDTDAAEWAQEAREALEKMK